MNLRSVFFFITFLLLVVPLIGSRALAQTEAHISANSQPEAKTKQEPEAKTKQEPDDDLFQGPQRSRDEMTGTLSVAEAAQVADVHSASESEAAVGKVSEKYSGKDSAKVDAKQILRNGLAASACLRDLGETECILTYGFRVVEFYAIGEEVIARFQRLDGTVNDADVVVMSSHIEDAALNDRVNLDESPVIFAQFQQLSGSRYEIPQTADEIKRSLGFSEDTPIAAVDWLEILKVHLERTLSTTPTVSDLILDLLGVELNPVVIETN